MRKGIAISTLLGLIIAAIILILFAPMLIKAAGAVWNKILTALGVIKPSALEKAIECAYYRCVEGCLSTRVVQEITWEEDGREVRCNDFCGLTDFMEGDKKVVCGWNAFQYPVEIQGASAENIGKKIGEIDFDCIIPGDSKKVGWKSLPELVLYIFPLPHLPTVLINLYFNNLYIADASIITSRTITECRKTGPEMGMQTIEDAIETFSVKTDKKLYIFTVHNEGFGYDMKMTGIITISPYVKIPEKEKPLQANLSQDKLWRIVIEPINEEYRLQVRTGTDVKGEEYISIWIKNKTFSESRILRPSDPDYYLGIKEGYLYIRFIDVTNDGIAVLNLTYTSTGPSITPEYLPQDKDAWTEEQKYIDHGWAALHERLVDDIPPTGIGSKSVYGEYTEAIRLKFSFWDAEGKLLDIDNYDKLHFWFKSDNSGTLNISFVAKEGVPYPYERLICSLGEYKREWGWHEYTLDLEKDDCYWLTERKPIMSIEFNLITGTGEIAGIGNGYIDNLYLCKNCGFNPNILGDVDGDCTVSQEDLKLCGEHFNEDWPSCDWNQNGIVDIFDLATVSKNIGYTCTSPPPVTSPPPAPPA